jgi:hypothetical protein
MVVVVNSNLNLSTISITTVWFCYGCYRCGSVGVLLECFNFPLEWLKACLLFELMGHSFIQRNNVLKLLEVGNFCQIEMDGSEIDAWLIYLQSG